VNLGEWLSYVPPHAGEVKQVDGRLLPEEYKCHFKSRLRNQLAQPPMEQDDIWFIADDGSNVTEAVVDAAASLRERLTWFERFRNPEEVLDFLLRAEEETGETWGFGAKGSPVRNYMIGYVSVHLGHYDRAAAAFDALLASGAMEDVHDRVRHTLELVRPM
jgi:hypothetical protein